MKQNTLIAVGRKIRFHRARRGLSQEEAADLAGLDRAYYGGIERGERNVATINLIKIASTLKLEVGDLFPSIAILRRASDGR